MVSPSYEITMSLIAQIAVFLGALAPFAGSPHIAPQTQVNFRELAADVAIGTVRTASVACSHVELVRFCLFDQESG